MIKTKFIAETAEKSASLSGIEDFTAKLSSDRINLHECNSRMRRCIEGIRGNLSAAKTNHSQLLSPNHWQVIRDYGHDWMQIKALRHGHFTKIQTLKQKIKKKTEGVGPYADLTEDWANSIGAVGAVHGEHQMVSFMVDGVAVNIMISSPMVATVELTDPALIDKMSEHFGMLSMNIYTTYSEGESLQDFCYALKSRIETAVRAAKQQPTEESQDD